MGPSNSQGASIRLWRSAARKVVVFQCPCGALVWSRRPRCAHPRSGVMLVRVQVSSMKTRRSGSMRLWYLHHCASRRAAWGRSRYLPTTVFCEAQLLGVNEVPDRPIIDLEATLGEFGYKPAQGEVPCLGALQQPSAVLARNCLRLVPTHLPRRHPSGLTHP